MTVRLLVERNGDREGVVFKVSDTGIIKYYIISGYQFIQRSNDNDWSSILGVGIAENHLSNIFQRFHRVESHSYHEGTGIGLALVKEFVTRHGGEISVKSQLNVGSTFPLVWFPSGSDHLPQKQVYLKSKRDEHEQVNLDINLYLYECMQRVQESESESSSQRQSKEDDQLGNSPMQIDNESLSSTSSPRPDEWSALRMKPSDIDFENTRKYILVVDDNSDMRYVHINMNLVLLYLPECKHLW